MSDATTESPIKVDLRRQRDLTRWPCAICGGSTDKEEYAAVFNLGDGDEFVCIDCVRAGASEVQARLLYHAEGLERRARFLRYDAEREWQLPSLDEYMTANGYDRQERDWAEDTDGRYSGGRASEPPEGW
jgi:hypothetical protein